MTTGLRITGGSARGRVLRAFVLPGVRPTSSRVREALFSIVGHDLGGQRVLDAFGGSGLLALEAWSRGADVTCVERDPAHARGIAANAADLGGRIDLRVGDVAALAPTLGTFDGVLADPPYADDPARWLTILAPLASSWLAYEADAGRRAPPRAGRLRLDRARDFGGTALWIYRSEEGP